MVNYISTRNSAIKITSSRAILNGQAPDGGLYVPEDLSAIKLTDYHEVTDNDFRGMAKVVWNIFFPDYGEAVIADLVDKSYKNKFITANEELSNEPGIDKIITPLAAVGSNTAGKHSAAGYVLELYHGPTAAFKDIALSALPNLLTKAREINNFRDEILILTATSGDTGSAALCGFSDVPGTNIIVFYPEGGVSETQKLQMVTATGKNTTACAIRGNFDDAQTGVKKLFKEIPQPTAGVSLSSANSINIGRLVPQIVYYFSAYRQLVDSGAIKDGDKVNFTVPTGNFGDIMAGYYAMKMGLPVNRLICASNRNDVLTEFLETGHYNRKRDFHKTTSPSMDILVSSNLERLLYYVCGEEHTIQYMKDLQVKGEYQITSEELTEIQKTFVGLSSSDEEGSDTIGRVYKKYNYLMDTHTAIAWSCFEKFEAAQSARTDGANSGLANIVLSTASPYKFCAAVLNAIGEPTGSDRENMENCHRITKAPIPVGLAGIFEKPVRHNDVINIEDMRDYVISKS